MNKNKTLFLHELKNLRWFFLVGMLGAVAYLVIQNSMVNSSIYISGLDNYDGTSGGIFNLNLRQLIISTYQAMFLGIGIMAMVQFIQEKHGNNRFFLLSLPFTKAKIFVIRYLAGVLVITIPFAVFLGGTVLMNHSYFDAIMMLNVDKSVFSAIYLFDTAQTVFKQIFIYYMFALALYSVMMMFQTFTKSAIFSAVVGAIATGVPAILMYSVNNILMFGMNAKGFSGPVKDLCKIFWGGIVAESASITTKGGGEYYEVLAITQNTAGKSFLLLCIMAVTFVIGFMVYRNKERVSNNTIFTCPAMKIIFLVVFVICVVAVQLYNVYDREDYPVTLIMSLLVSSGIAVGIYFIMRVIEGGGKR